MKITGRVHFMFFCVGFCLGVLVLNLGKGILLDVTDFFGEDTLYRMKYMSVDGNALFCYCLGKRLVPIVFFIMLTTTYLGLVVCRGTALWYGMSVGIYLSALAVRYGLKGIILALVSVFPHYICYIPACFGLLIFGEELYRGIYYRQGGFDVHDKRGMLLRAARLLGILALIIVGCALESHVNSALLIKYLQIF